MNEPKQNCCFCRTKHRNEKEERDLLNRLNRIEGQIRGIRGMVENGAYCPDILIQVSDRSQRIPGRRILRIREISFFIVRFNSKAQTVSLSDYHRGCHYFFI